MIGLFSLVKFVACVFNDDCDYCCESQSVVLPIVAHLFSIPLLMWDHVCGVCLQQQQPLQQITPGIS